MPKPEVIEDGYGQVVAGRQLRPRARERDRGGEVSGLLRELEAHAACEQGHDQLIERLRAWAEHERPESAIPSDADRQRDLLAAADLLEEGESRAEYRVVADTGPTLYYREGDLDRARRQVAYGQERGRPGVRIQTHVVTETPWIDLEDVSEDG